MDIKIEEPIKILLIEDNEGDIILTTEAFKSAATPNRLYVCQDAEAGLAFLRKEDEYHDAPRPDLILLDLNLPLMNGHEALEILKADEYLREIPVVVMTSSAAERDIAESYRRYANSYIVKPFGMEELLEVVQGIEKFWFNISRLPAGTYIPPYKLNG